ncbi:phosphonate ABC transporter, permease protein PhnE [Chthonobacter rhizosphaerae]|uniref:phosphonate ABC transporter, permease protein PhnE n=1 Tax=Chthonobacter rhizosphaerae TaxID=2735553 RepID=UPI0015EEDA22|nr:phosphonate ABC transporter, permease protein PhnE [Chthonobacter rhizosphaerae]
MSTVTPNPERLDALKAAYASASAARRNRTLLGIAIFLAVMVGSAIVAEVNIGKLVAKFGNFTSYFERLAHLDSGALVTTDIGEWFWGLNHWLKLLAETLMIAYVGTIVGAVLGFLLCFPAARNLTRSAWEMAIVRRFLEFCRTVPEIVFALIFVVAFGLGPLPGVLAIAIHTTGALGKLFSEVVENIDMKPVDGILASGGNRVQVIRFAVVPQVLSNFLSYALLRFEINVRGAAIMGFVGAGGIGQDLLESVRKFYYSDVSAILLLIIATVFVIDMVTERARHALIGREAHR